MVKWYTFPIEIQEMFVLLMLNAQQPSIIRGYGKSSVCSRFAFKEVTIIQILRY